LTTKAPDWSGPFKARAKVNLYLHVTGRRDDGYHELDSLFVRVDLADRLWLAPSDQDRLEVSGPFANAIGNEPPYNNLAMRALSALHERSGRRDRFSVHLEKNIPVTGGLGGGSADAAAMLRVAAPMLGVDDGELESVALELGADVPPCLHDEPVLASGIGEVLRAAPRLPVAALVLVNPGVAVPTPAVFAARSGPFSPLHPLQWSPVTVDDLMAMLADRANDLEQPAIGIAPVIADVLETLDACPGIRLARMSGSGATCFGLAAVLDEAQAAASAIARDHPAWWCGATEILVGR